MSGHFFHPLHVDSGSIADYPHLYSCTAQVEQQRLEGADDDSRAIETRVVRARDQEQQKSMAEWIFRFHRSFSSLVRDIVGTVNVPTMNEARALANVAPAHARTTRITIHRRRGNTVYSFPTATVYNRSPTWSPNVLCLSPSRSPPHPVICEASSRTEVSLANSNITPVLVLRMEQESPPEGELVEAIENTAVVVKSKSTKRYVPPRLRGLSSRQQQQQQHGLQSLEEREMAERKKPSPGNSSTQHNRAPSYLDRLNSVPEGDDLAFRYGGCADPKLANGSIMDPANVPRNASKVMKSRSEAIGCFGGSKLRVSIPAADRGAEKKPSCWWETGAVSACGNRDSNEDAYLIVRDLREADMSSDNGDRPMGLFAIFDGHCGNQAARYAAEKITFFLHEELERIANSKDENDAIESALRQALKKLDEDFCRICQEGGREWDSGTTAIVAVIIDKCLVIANLGDCRGVLCRSVNGGSAFTNQGWNELDAQTGHLDEEKRHCVWKEVANVHKPSDEKEKQRIERANGWVTTETEIPNGQLGSVDSLGEDVVRIMRKCFSGRYEPCGSTNTECRAAPNRILQISRVCGELSVSRALGDRQFKAASFQTKSGQDERTMWEDSLAYPSGHSRSFHGNLVDNSPDCQQIQICEEGCTEEFILLASDGLWDVLDVDDAVRVTHDLLFQRQWTAKRTAATLADIAIHLGSSDNITVIVIRVMDGHQTT